MKHNNKKIIGYILLLCFLAVPGTVLSYAQEVIPYVLVSATENSTESGNASPITISSGYSIRYEMSDVEYSIPVTEWIAENPVEVKITFTAKPGYSFTDSTGFKSYTLSYKSNSGDDKVRTAIYTYTPKKTLNAPKNFHYSESTVVKWDKVQDAKQYILKIYEDDELVKTVRTTATSYDISEFGANDSDLKITVAAMSSKSKTATVLESIDVTPEDEEYRGDNTVSGRFKETERGKYFLQDDDLGKAYGWQYINGNWYYFNEDTGYAFCSGWVKASDGNWYYFKTNGKMATGWLTSGNYRYFLNNQGTNDTDAPDAYLSGLPYGAMVTGEISFGPSEKKTYLFNDGRRTDLPLGALIE